MPTYESSADIAADTSAVWRLLSDVASWPLWLPTVTKVVALDGNPLALGSRFVVHQPGLRPATWRVTELEAPSRFTWEARSPGLRMVARHSVVPREMGSSVVRLQFSFEGMLGGILGSLFRSVTERYLAQEAAALKASAESSCGLLTSRCQEG